MDTESETGARMSEMQTTQARTARRRGAAATFAIALGLAACGSDSEPAGTSPTSTTGSTVAPATTIAAPTTVAATTTESPTTTVEPTSESCPEFTDMPDLPVELCDKGAKVLEVQEGLVAAGFDIVVDGFFGGQTRTAVQQFQAANNLEVDGVVGPITFAALFPDEPATTEPATTDG